MAVKKKATTNAATKKNKLGVKKSLINNINANKKKGTSKSKAKRSVDKKLYDAMKDNWGKN